MDAHNGTVKVGVGVLLVKWDGPTPLVLVGRRKGSHGAGTYALPGGHLEYMEDFATCGAREVLEETGIVLQPGDLSFAYATNNIIDNSKHYVTIFMRADVAEDTQSQLLEPHKCDGWSWVPYHQVPEPHFSPLAALLSSPYKLER